MRKEGGGRERKIDWFTMYHVTSQVAATSKVSKPVARSSVQCSQVAGMHIFGLSSPASTPSVPLEDDF